jgi:chromosome partitioning protein
VELAAEDDRVTRFGTVIDKYRDKYDVVIIDTPPTLGLLTLSALYAADEAIISVQSQYLAVRGLVTMIDIVKTVGDVRGSELPYNVLFTQYDKRKSLHRMTYDEVASAGFPVFDTKIRDNVALAEAPATGLDIFSYAKSSNGAQDYEALTTEYLSKNNIERIDDIERL